MKKLFSFIAILSLLLTSCEGLDSDGQNGNNGGMAATDLFKSSELALLNDCDAEGGLVSLSFTPSYNWSAYASAYWITVTPNSGVAGAKTSLKVKIAENNSTEIREGKVFVELSNGKIVGVPVSQKAGKGVLELVDGATYSVDGNGGYFNVKVRTNINEEAYVLIPSSAESWLSSVETATRAMRTDIVTLLAQENGTNQSREAKVKVYYGNEKVEFTITQAPAEKNKPSLSIAPPVSNVPATGGSVKIDVLSNTNWTVNCAAGGATINPASGNGNGSVTITLPETSFTRDVTVTFTATLNGETKEAVAKLTQTVSSSSDGGGDEGGSSGNLTESPLTPQQHQANLVNTGEELLKYFNPDDSRVLTTSITELCDAGGFDFYADGSDLAAATGGQTTIDLSLEESRATKSQSLKSHKLIKNIFTSVLGIAKFSPKSASRLSTSLVFPEDDESYSLDEYKGNKYVFNYSSRGWKEYKGAHTGNKMTAIWGTSVATLTWVEGNGSWEGYIDYDYKAKLTGIPSKLNFEIAVDGHVELAIEVIVSVPNNYAIDTKTAITLNGGYAFSVVAKADRQSVEGSVVIAKNGTKLVNGGGKIYINDLTNSANWWVQEEREWSHSWWDGYEWHTQYYTYPIIDFNWDYLDDTIQNGRAYATILNIGLQAAGDLRTIIDEGKKIENTLSYDGATLLSNYINANASALLYYVDTNEKMADVKAEAVAYEYWDYDYGYVKKYGYEASPVIVFADGSRWKVDEYFTETAFGTLIDSAELLLERYIDLVE